MTFFSPSSITCFFSVHKSKNPSQSGSTGVGITLDIGVTVKISGRGIKVNGEKRDFPTVEYVMKKLGCEGIEIEMDVPAGYGFGMSGASALASAFEINRAFELKKSFFELVDLAHEAEIVCRTGMGDVVCQSYGGVIVRKKAGAPSVCEIDRLFWDEELDFLFIEPMKTEEVLRNESKIQLINRYGELCLREFLSKPEIRNLFYLSKKFSEKTGLLDDELREIIEEVELHGGFASMVMLGRAIFTYNGYDVLRDYGEPFRAKISRYGVREVRSSNF
ncbi:MAG TPA: GHMP kinase [Archaeoglobaceae archaeon]|nr:GHMP kinase [Archaeoglobaceae archaeon]